MDIEPCVCGDDINEMFCISQLWAGFGPEDVYMAFCSRCYQVAPFTAYRYGPDSVNEAAITAWNRKMIAMRESRQ